MYPNADGEEGDVLGRVEVEVQAKREEKKLKRANIMRSWVVG
jgi:hypothetical protein